MHPPSPARRHAGRPALLVLAGCGSLAPLPKNPDAPVPDQFAHAQPHDAAARPSTALDAAGNPVTTAAAQPVAADISWKEFFVSPALQQLIQIALDNNRDLRLAALNVERTQALYRIQRADRLPSVNGSFGLQRQPSVLTGEQTSNYSIGLGITAFELDFFGRVKDLTRAALSSYMATEEAQRTAQIALVAGVANAYLGLQSLDEQLAAPPPSWMPSRRIRWSTRRAPPWPPCSVSVTWPTTPWPCCWVSSLRPS